MFGSIIEWQVKMFVAVMVLQGQQFREVRHTLAWFEFDTGGVSSPAGIDLDSCIRL